MKENKSIDILQVITALDVGGAERVVLELVKESQSTSKMAVAYLLNQTALKEQYKGLDVSYFWLGVNKDSVFSFFKAINSLNKIIDEYDVKVLHAHMFHALVISLFVKYLYVKKVEVIFTSHSFKGFSFLRSLFIYSSKSLRTVDVVFSKKQHPILNKKNYRIIRNGVSQNYRTKPVKSNSSFTFISVGRLELPKNHEALILAFNELPDTDSKLIIVGDGSLRKDLQNLIQELDLQERVILAGLQKNVTDFLHNADCFVLSSSWEGMPMALLEAGMSGIPIISTNVGAIPEIVKPEQGYIVDLKGLTSAMRYVMDNYDEALIKAEKFKHYVNEEFSSYNMAKKHNRLYNSLISDL